jgi:hypothetical protein
VLRQTDGITHRRSFQSTRRIRSGRGISDVGECRNGVLRSLARGQANTSDRDGVATVTFAPDWTVPGPLASIQVNLPRRSRKNIRLGDVLPSLGETKTGVIVESDGVEIVVEPAQYRSTGGVTWAAGHAALATKLQ